VSRLGQSHAKVLATPFGAEPVNVQPRDQVTVSRRHHDCSLGGLLLAEVLGGNAVHVHGALLGQALAHGDGGALLRLVLDLADETGLVELLEAVADVLASSLEGLLSAGSTAGLATEVLAESVDANLLSHVELVADGGGAGEEPVVVVRAQFLEEGSLYCLRPLLNIILIIARQRITADGRNTRIWRTRAFPLVGENLHQGS
jgi:hypothetical protein